ncbi:MAG: hypothetical protein IPP87_11470 [Ideonella sp.]|nr:hypothetical protein [Ideonella sp.]
MIRCALAAILAVSLASPAMAQLARPFPANTLRGALVVVHPPNVSLNGQAARLSPGSRIRNAKNMLQLSGSLVGQELLVHYTLDGAGQLHDVWILTPQELAKEPWPTTLEQAKRWVFDPAAQAWERR